jgi:hypothetical protein
VVLMGSRSPRMWTPRSGSGSEVVVLGGLPAIRRVDEIETAQVVSAWRALRWRNAEAIAVAGTDAESSAGTTAYSAGCAG